MYAISLAKYRARKKTVIQSKTSFLKSSIEGEIVELEDYRGKKLSAKCELLVVEVPAVACQTERGYGVAMATALGGEILYFCSAKSFEFARRDALLHGKSITAFARERTTIGDYPAAVRQLKSEAV